MRIFRCNICGNIVEVLHQGRGKLVCCNQEMELLEEKTGDAEKEKHVPFIQKVKNGYLVKVGENEEHPMVENHFIELIELNVDGIRMLKKLKPGDKPEAFFECPEGNEVSAREYCTVHGLWKS